MRADLSVLRVLALACFSLCTIASGSAATKPLFYPRGLAIDPATGNLYVANSGGNNILVYNPNYIQLTGKTITANIINPTGVAFDPFGNLWVANYGTSNNGPNGSVAEYTKGVQNQSNSITNGISGPNAIAIDGNGIVFVQNNSLNVTVYGPGQAFASPITLLTTWTPPLSPVFGIAAEKGTLAFGSTSASSFCVESVYFSAGQCQGTYYYSGGYAMASDKSGGFYYSDLNNNIWHATSTGSGSNLTVAFSPGGIAVDSVRGRLYISDSNGNKIYVYTTQGLLLYTIQ